MINRVNEALDSMTKTERQVAEYFLTHAGEFAFLTLDKLRKEIGRTSPTLLKIPTVLMLFLTHTRILLLIKSLLRICRSRFDKVFRLKSLRLKTI